MVCQNNNDFQTILSYIMIKYYVAKLLRVPRRFRMIYYIYFNRLKFRLNDVKFGRNMQVYTKFFLNKAPGSKITIGDDFIYTNGDAFNPLCRNICGCMYTAFPHSQITIGNGTGISSACLWANSSIAIGSRVKIGGDCILMDSDAHNLDYRIRASKELIDKISKDVLTAKTAPIVIEDDVLIGTRCIILKGVTIGARSVIGSGSVVTKSIPPDCIAVGNPCRVIKIANKKIEM